MICCVTCRGSAWRLSTDGLRFLLDLCCLGLLPLVAFALPEPQHVYGLLALLIAAIAAIVILNRYVAM
jgi:hypothetical protein